MNKFASGKSHGKIILIGEHSVVYENLAIALPLTANKVVVTVAESENGIILDSDLYKGELKNVDEKLKHIAILIEKIFENFKVKSPKVLISVNSDLPLRRGMGSSAAVATALVRALYNYYDIDLSIEDNLKLTDFSENLAHGRSSGIDARATIYDKPILFSKNGGVKNIDLNLKSYLVIADTGIEGETRKAVEFVRFNYPENKDLINDLKIYTELAIKAISVKDEKALGKYMTSSHNTLKSLGVSHIALDKLVEYSLREGALGAKLTGGGLGGLMIALCKNKQSAITLSEKLKLEGAKKVWIQHMNL